MANWNLPTITSNYINFVAEVNGKLFDASRMYYADATGIPQGAMRFNRGGFVFDEWDAANNIWLARQLGVTGGGTGSNTAAGARANLGIGSMGVQNSNAVNITGGSITGVAYNANDITSGILSLARGGTGYANALGAYGTTFICDGNRVIIYSGSAIAELNASALVTGTVPLARLSGVATGPGSNGFYGQNTFNGDISGDFPVLFSGSNTPGFNFYSGSGPAGNKRSRIYCWNGDMYFQLVADDGSTAANYMAFLHTGVITGYGGGLSNLQASQVTSGQFDPARLGAGVANSSTFLRGDGLWAAAGGGGGGTVEGIPSGLIAMFDTNCPANWTRVSSMDNRMPIGSTAFGGTGGNTTHYHNVGLNTGGGGAHGHSFSGSVTIDGNVDQNTQKVTLQYGTGSAIDVAYINHNHHLRLSGDVGGNTSNVGDHTHQVNGNSSVENHMPPYIGVVFCRKN